MDFRPFRLLCKAPGHYVTSGGYFEIRHTSDGWRWHRTRQPMDAGPLRKTFQEAKRDLWFRMAPEDERRKRLLREAR